ncbi:MAG TPA: hypothetical protein VJB57_18300 [Dehalococcoidia bacterium]|nr:hypothetical protein [Dehalococcoidia bacterium]
MKLFDSMRSKLSGQTAEKFGEGQRFPLTKPMVKSIKQHIGSLRETDLDAYTYERRRSDYSQAKSDLMIYDREGQAVLHGRESDGPLNFWQA